MKIDNSVKLPPSLPNNSSAQARNTVERTTPQTTQEPVQFSAIAAQLKNEIQPPVDKTRVQEIKQAIAEGRFKISSDAIADRLLASAREMIDSQRRA